MDELEQIREKKRQELAAESGADWPSEPVNVNDGNIGDFVKRYDVVLVDCWAPWCGPCRITSPILADLAAEYGGDIYVYKIDVDKEPELARAFGVQSIPMFLFIPMNEQPQVAMGALPKKSFKEAIDNFLLKKDNQTGL